MKTKKIQTIVATIGMLALVALLYLSSASPVQGIAPEEVKATYKAKCAVCHGLDGKAETAKGKELKVRDLRSQEVQKMSDAKLLEVIMKGQKKMPGYEKMLGADKCRELVSYCRQLAK